MLVGIASLEEDGAVIAPVAVLHQAMQGAGTHVVLAGAHDDVLLPISGEIVRVTEVVRQPSGAAVDEDALLVPVNERCVHGVGLGNHGTGIVHSGVDDAGRAIVVIDTATPAALDVIGLTRGNSNGFLSPQVEVLARDVSPMQA